MTKLLPTSRSVRFNEVPAENRCGSRSRESDCPQTLTVRPIAPFTGSAAGRTSRFKAGERGSQYPRLLSNHKPGPDLFWPLNDPSEGAFAGTASLTLGSLSRLRRPPSCHLRE